MAHSSTSQSHSKKTQQFHFRATFESEDIQLVVHIRKFHQHNIELSIENLQKKRSYNTEGITVLVVLVLLQTKDLKCATYLLNEKFRNMSEEKKTIVRDLGFGGLMHIPPLRVNHQLLRELANNFKLGENRLETGYGSFKIRQKTIGDALGINVSGDLFPQKVNYKKLSEDDKEIFRRFQGKTLKSLTDEMMDIGVGNEQDRLMFKRIFILYIQMAFLLPTTINKISPVYLTPIFEMDTITERNWGGHVLSFIIKDITDYKEEKKKAIDGCLFALMIIYFIFLKIKTRKGQKDLQNHGLPTGVRSRHNPKKKKVVVDYSSPEEDQSYHGYRYEIGSEDLDELLRENNKNSAAQGEKETDMRSTEGHYVPSETIPDVNLGSDDPSSQGLTEQSSVNRPTESMLSMVEESASESADSNMMVVKEETPSEKFRFKFVYQYPKQPLSQNFKKHLKQNMNQALCYKLKNLQKPLLNPHPQQLQESTPTLSPAPSKINPAPEDAAVLMMMARTASYIPKTDPMPSFSLDFTDSSQEEITTQEGASMQDEHRAKTPETLKLLEQLEDLVHKIASGGVTKKEKSPPIPKESGAESFEKFETPVKPNLNTTDMKQKYYHWAIRVKTYSNGRTDEFDDICRLQAQDRYTLSKFHLASLAPKSHIEAEIVTAMCFIINQQNIPRFQEEVYCLSPDILNMTLANHPDGVFLQPKNDKPFSVEDYPMFIPFLDLQKLKLHRYDEVDHFRVEYASRILCHDMNLDKDEAIRGSNAIRLSKPSSFLLSPYCQIDFSGC
ncbi:hypothetical protein Ahy_B02g057860 [Arachis hypogaea]|uniref:Aminotransferase-like plant mobile domain-containing protein n=1 Tax=Arachis hypogaea TaxID=3818 RepID=A0A445AD44_ARAHY|nr:hypothetical protein Ahy_B02g057860 [Arachis hypogaea]